LRYRAEKQTPINRDENLNPATAVGMGSCYYMSTESLNSVNTSNNVEETGNKVASCFDIVAGVERALSTSQLLTSINSTLLICSRNYISSQTWQPRQQLLCGLLALIHSLLPVTLSR